MHMNSADLKSSIHKIVDCTENERLLQAIYDFLGNSEANRLGQLWESLTAKEKEEVLLSFEESEDDSNLIDRDELFKKPGNE